MQNNHTNIKGGGLELKTSNLISCLRFPLCVLIVLLHSRISLSFFGDVVGNCEWVEILSTFFSSIFLVNSAVPLFFIFSGYLLVIKNDRYGIMLFKRLKTLVIPYVLWILIFILVYIVFECLGSARNNIHNMDLKDWFSWIFGMPKNTAGYYHPVIGQYWYIRDLVLVCLLSPIIIFLIEKFAYLYFSFVFLFWQSGLPLSYEWGNAFLFFGLGCFFARKNISAKYLDKVSFRNVCLAYLFMVLISLVCLIVRNNQMKSILTPITIITGGLLLLKSGYLFSNRFPKLRDILKTLSVYSFWIFTVHQPWFIKGFRTVFSAILPHNAFGILIVYIGTFLCSLFFSLLIGIIIKKLLPSFFNILVGNKNRNDYRKH